MLLKVISLSFTCDVIREEEYKKINNLENNSDEGFSSLFRRFP